MPQHNHDNPLLKGSENLPEILAQQTTGNDPIPSLCPPANGKFIERSQEWAQRQLEGLVRFGRLGIDYSSLSAKDGDTRLPALLDGNPNLSNEPIFLITNPNKNMSEAKRDYAAYNAAKEESLKLTTWEKWQISNVSKTAVGYDVARGHKRAKAARKSRQKNRK